MDIITSNKSQILKLSLIVALVFMTPLLSSSLRSTYLYFLFNLLIIALGAEAGLLSFFSKSAQEKKLTSLSSSKSIVSFLTPKIPLLSSTNKEDITITTNEKSYDINSEDNSNKKMVIVNAIEKRSSSKIVSAVKVLQVLKKCPSTPSLFFIGGSDHRDNEAMATEEEEYEHEEDGEEEVLPSGQELFHKAEKFIGNFYKQLKMQREDSWKKIHGLYHKAL